jgi:hypothetical protein
MRSVLRKFEIVAVAAVTVAGMTITVPDIAYARSLHGGGHCYYSKCSPYVYGAWCGLAPSYGPLYPVLYRW